jgi:phosphoribosylglycinamide formyltransferase 1
MAKLHLGFLASHSGSNMQAIIDACRSGELNAEPCCIVSNNSKSGAADRASRESIPFYHISSVTHPVAEELAAAIIVAFERHGVDTIVLAGYMKPIDGSIIRRFNSRVLNIHPALLPKYGGKGMYGEYVHKAVLEAGDKTSGATVHLVNNEYDRGRILQQIKVPVFVEDTVETLAARVLEQEHFVYKDTLIKISNGEIVI